MTNLQEGATRISAPVLRRLWLWLPIGLGGALALALGASLLAPLWVSLDRDSRKLREVEDLLSQLDQQRLIAKSLDEQEEKAAAQQQKLIRLFAGNGDISTFMAKLDQLAKANGVQLDLYEPRSTGAEADKSLDKNNDGKVDPQEAQAAPRGDKTLESQGLKTQGLTMSARGGFPELLPFLRQIEALNVLVAQSDLQLTLDQKTQAPGAPPLKAPVVLQLALKLFGKSDVEPQTKPAAQVPGQPPPNSPPNGAPAAPALSN